MKTLTSLDRCGSLLLVSLLLLVGCGPPAPATGSKPSGGGASAPAAGGQSASEPSAAAAPAGSSTTVKVAAVWPLTGSFAYNGQASLNGAKYAVQRINDAGGIQALGGARLELVSADAGSSGETAVSAAKNVLGDAAVVAGLGSWLTSFTLATTEVAERERVPWLVDSYGDQVTQRNMKYVFAIAPPASELGRVMYDALFQLADAQGKQVRAVALVGDNTPAAVPPQDALAELLKGRGVNVPVQERWNPPLSDASAIAQKIQSANVDVVLMVGYAFNDVAQLTQQLKARNVKALLMQLGGQSMVPQWRDLGDTAADMVGVLSFVPLRSSKAIADDMARALDQPFVQQDNLTAFALTLTLKEALEKAGKADRQAVRDALANLDVTSGPLAEVMPMRRVKFDATGRIVDRYGVAAQWQQTADGLMPCTVLPTAEALCKPNWPGS